VLRAPRRESVVEDMAIEGRVLDVIGDRLPVAVPKWTVREPGFVGYRRLPGEPAAEKGPDGLVWERPLPDGFFDRLGATIAALHTIPTDGFAAAGVEFRSPRQVRETIDRALHRGRDLLGLPDPLWRRRREWAADDDAWPPHSVLVHADLHPGHTLVSGGELVGVIHWTDIVVGDPAADFPDRPRFRARATIRCARRVPAARRPDVAGHAQAHRRARRDGPGELRAVRCGQRTGPVRRRGPRAVR
jgi:macrolide phosphotransferase